MGKSTILVESATRKLMKQVARKDQTYDDLINELIKSKGRNQEPLDRRFESLQSSESHST